ncbi:MAG: DUF5312 family protein [Treponemataceae bacterium]|nr:DUF5312 family protein [Treponemataceae bacterium]
MGFFSSLFNFFSSLFSGLSPEVKLKQDMRKIEAELKNMQPLLYKNGAAQPAFAEAFRLLQLNTKPIEAVLAATFKNQDLNIRNFYTGVLIETGFSDRAKSFREKLQYETRKADFFESINEQRIIDSQRHDLEAILREIMAPNFSQIERILQSLDLLYDLCAFPYTPLIRQFDPEFLPEATGSEHHYTEVPLEAIEKKLLDFHYITGNLVITASMGRALCALAIYAKGGEVTEKSQNELLSALKKTSNILRKIITPQVITQFMKLIRNDISFIPKTSMENRRYISEYAERLKKQFENDTQRIQLEIQNDVIEKETKSLFNEKPLLELEGYNQGNNSLFQQCGAGSFLWILPLQIIKSFEDIYISDKVKALLNDLVVEGFFNNPQYKSDFSAIVYNCVEGEKNIKAFEDSFGKGQPNDTLLMTGYLRDSRTNPDFLKNLTQMINSINKEAKKLLQKEVAAIYQLWQKLQELIPDSKKPQPELISNLKVLFMSPRNRDNAEFLETSFSQWSIFLDVMKNYAIIGDVNRDE